MWRLKISWPGPFHCTAVWLFKLESWIWQVKKERKTLRQPQLPGTPVGPAHNQCVLSDFPLLSLSLSLSLPLATHSHEMWSSGISKPCRAPYSESLETWSLLGHLEFTRKLGVYSDIWSLLGNLEFTRILGVYSDTWSLLENLEFTRKLGVYSKTWSSKMVKLPLESAGLIFFRFTCYNKLYVTYCSF